MLQPLRRAPEGAMAQVAFFVPFSFGRGVERVNVTLAKALAARGIEVDVVVARGNGPYFGELNGRAHLVELAVGRTPASLVPLARYLRRRRPPVLLSAPDAGSIVALLARRLARVDTRIVTVTHAVLSRSLKRKPGPYRRAFPHLLRRLYATADALVAVSGAVADDLAQMARLPRSRVHVIPNPVVHDGLLVQTRDPADHPWLQSRSAPVILSVGCLNGEKNYGDLLRAFARLRPERRARLIILGEGTERARLERLAADLGVADDVSLPGFVSNPYGYMARADLLALSSNYEALPTVVIEALACGCPVVATDCPGGVREILGGGRWGRLVPAGDHEAMKEALQRTLHEPPCPERLRQRALEFHVDRVVDRYLRVLDVDPA
jgi:glycosyltransferase involved in cell wall biosynthesis